MLCLAAALLWSAQVAAQTATESLVVAQTVPKRAQPLPPKPVGADELDQAARVNDWTVGLAGGLLEGTFVRYAADLGKALDDGENLRVLPIISYGAVGNITDLIYLKGVDFAITYADALDHFKNVAKVSGIERRVNYVIPMFQGEVHILARPEIKSISDLEGKKVNFNTVGSAANYTGGIVFDRLGIKTERLFLNNSIAVEKMLSGEIAAVVHVVGKPNELFTKMKTDAGFHFLPLEFTSKFEDYYVPAQLTSGDYPSLIPQGQPIETISVPALLAVYNWDKDTRADRYRRCVRFVEYLFDRFNVLRAPPYQPGWRQINLAGTVPGWTRFPPAQEQLDKIAARSAGVDPALAKAQIGRVAPGNQAEQERLFQQFVDWAKKNKK
jgi:TRAP-type uncharacterized transport system substrate-binding protein